jgi:hypothetical protein
MSHSSMPEEQQTKLKQAAALMSVVQTEMAARADRGSDDYIKSWKDLYWLRERLNEFIRYGFVLFKGDSQPF